MTRLRSRTRSKLACVALAVLVGGASASCANCDESRYYMSYGTVSSDIYPCPWSATVFFESHPERFRVHLPVDVDPEREMLEFFEEGGRPLGIAGTLRPDIESSNDCFAAVIEYDVEFLPDGEYLMVHRRSSAPPGLDAPELPWSSFEGEQAVVTSVFLDGDARTAARADAGL